MELLSVKKSFSDFVVTIGREAFPLLIGLKLPGPSMAFWSNCQGHRGDFGLDAHIWLNHLFILTLMVSLLVVPKCNGGPLFILVCHFDEIVAL